MTDAPTSPVFEALRRDLTALEDRQAGVSRSAPALALLVLAHSLDSAAGPLSARVAAARELREGFTALRASLPPEDRPDRLDELVAARRSRRATSTSALGRPS
ncbi:MAG TPA: hypothetical protein VNT51_01955 [Miltoncostaeaceae bacterium]|nr:hypothetical protein [Miltoncostaeaceae bacterium]